MRLETIRETPTAADSGRTARPQAATTQAKRRLSLSLAGALALWLGAVAPAAALMPPYVYENARRNAASVVVIAVEAVSAPEAGFGECRVKGTVRKVERGTAYAPGAPITLAVPCRKAGAQPPLGGTIYQEVEKLKKDPFGRAYLDAEGRVVLSQYERLKALP